MATDDASNGFVVEVEAQVLGAILSGGANSAVFSLLDERHFLEPIHAEIFRAAKVAKDKYSTTTVPVVARLVDPIVAQQFKLSTGSDIGAYMAQCTTSTLYVATNAHQGARNVIGQWARITLGRHLALLTEATASPDADVLALAREIGEVVDEVSAGLRRGSRAKTRQSLQEAAKEMIAAAREARLHNGLTGVTTGLVDLDQLTGGLQRRDLILLGARPSMGKTSVATCIAASAAMAGNGIGFLSLEMDRPKLMARIGSDLMHRNGIQIPYEDLIKGSATDGEIDTAEMMLAKANLPLWIDDQAGLSITDIRMKVEAMASEAEQAGFALDLLVVDHLLKVRSTSRYAGNRVHEIAEITNGLKELAREYDMAVLLLTQLNRAVEQRDDKRPSLADLRDSGAIEQDADAVMLLYRDAYYLQRDRPTSPAEAMVRDEKLDQCRHLAELDVAKQRNGRIQSIDLYCDLQYSAFRNAARYGQQLSEAA